MTHEPHGIVPPHVLEHLAEHGNKEAAARAEHTLARDHQIRTARASETHDLPDAATAAEASDEDPDRRIHDCKHTTTLPGTLVRSEGQAAVKDVSVNQAYDGLGDTYHLYLEAYGRNSLDNKGLPLSASVHYDRNYDNAFWDGSQMVFGDGDGVIFGSFTTSVDVIGHELTHGVTEVTAGLTYRNQSGALNESMSDVFGSLVKQYNLRHTAAKADWLIGEGLFMPSVKGVALRSMKAPGTAYDDPQLGKDPQPDHMDHYVQTNQDNGGVHINSGIPNRAFYLTARALRGFAWKRAGQIWYDVLTGPDIRANCDFATFAELTVKAAAARFGAGGTPEGAVTKAWQTVGVLQSSNSKVIDLSAGVKAGR